MASELAGIITGEYQKSAKAEHYQRKEAEKTLNELPEVGK
mgnify:CR=1 FL=1